MSMLSLLCGSVILPPLNLLLAKKKSERKCPWGSLILTMCFLSEQAQQRLLIFMQTGKALFLSAYSPYFLRKSVVAAVINNLVFSAALRLFQASQLAAWLSLCSPHLSWDVDPAPPSVWPRYSVGILTAAGKPAVTWPAAVFNGFREVFPLHLHLSCWHYSFSSWLITAYSQFNFPNVGVDWLVRTLLIMMISNLIILPWPAENWLDHMLER